MGVIKGLSNVDMLMNLVDEFRILSERVSELGQSIGIKVVPYRDPRLPLFSELSLDQRRYAVDNLRVYLEICQATQDAGDSLEDSISITWSAIKYFGLRPSSDLFSYISKDNVIEFHDRNHLQIFRNFNFYHCCSYSLEELYAVPFTTLYARDTSVSLQLLDVIEKIFNGEILQTVATGLPPHIISEVHSPFKYEIQAEVPYLSPLFDDTKRAVAHVAIERGQVMGIPLSSNDEERLLEAYVLRQANLLGPN